MKQYKLANVLLSYLLLALGCGARHGRSSALTSRASSASVVVPQEPRMELYSPSIIAEGLLNPRGVLRDRDRLLVAEAGKGDPKEPLSARLLALSDGNHDGVYGDDERHVLLDHQRSMHILERMAMNRDEVFGLADIAVGNGVVLLSAVDLDKGSTLYRIEDDRITEWGRTPGNANSLAYDPVRDRWFAVQSFQNTVVELVPGGDARTLAQLAPLEQGQDAVPAAIAFEPRSATLLVVLFSGQLGGDTAGSGVDFVRRSGKIVRFDPDLRTPEAVVTGLTAPVDLIVEPDGRLLVLEFCNEFVDPMKSLPGPGDAPSHGGFARRTGRLLRIDLQRGESVLLAQGLDQPTHIEREQDGSILVSEGQGTPHRLVPGVSAPEPLMGRISRWSLAR